MSQEEQEKKVNNSEGISVRELFANFISGIKYIKGKWIYILLCAIAGAAAGLAYSIFQKPTYTAMCTFVLEETNKMGSLGQYTSLANLAGISLGNGGGGIFEGDNILELYKSRLMIEKALLSEANFDGKNE